MSRSNDKRNPILDTRISVQLSLGICDAGAKQVEKRGNRSTGVCPLDKGQCGSYGGGHENSGQIASSKHWETKRMTIFHFLPTKIIFSNSQLF